jgi:pyruvate dehydrogenase complex dehydrogenase (E1) component
MEYVYSRMDRIHALGSWCTEPRLIPGRRLMDLRWRFYLDEAFSFIYSRASKPDRTVGGHFRRNQAAVLAPVQWRHAWHGDLTGDGPNMHGRARSSTGLSSK